MISECTNTENSRVVSQRLKQAGKTDRGIAMIPLPRQSRKMDWRKGKKSTGEEL